MSIRLFRNAFRDLFRFRLGPPAMNPSLQIAGMPQKAMLEDLRLLTTTKRPTLFGLQHRKERYVYFHIITLYCIHDHSFHFSSNTGFKITKKNEQRTIPSQNETRRVYISVPSMPCIQEATRTVTLSRGT